MEIAIILLSFTTIINALHISYIYKEISKRIDREKIYLLNYIHSSVDEIRYINGVETQKLINDIKSGKLKK
nr:MAG TPA: hypothetical protein [Caudoviricetes sp.]